MIALGRMLEEKPELRMVAEQATASRIGDKLTISWAMPREKIQPLLINKIKEERQKKRIQGER